MPHKYSRVNRDSHEHAANRHKQRPFKTVHLYFQEAHPHHHPSCFVFLWQTNTNMFTSDSFRHNCWLKNKKSSVNHTLLSTHRSTVSCTQKAIRTATSASPPTERNLELGKSGWKTRASWHFSSGWGEAQTHTDICTWKQRKTTESIPPLFSAGFLRTFKQSVFLSCLW